MLDLDGTISELVPEPDQARISSRVAGTLRDLHSKLALLAIVTGRPVQQALSIVGLDQLVYVGNHGLETLEKGRTRLADEAQAFGPALQRLLTALQEEPPSKGLILEDKGASFAIHYRSAPEPEKTRADVLAAIDRLAGSRVRILMGKAVINVLPPVNLSKGTAVVSLANDHDLSAAILIGDDVTDIDSFRAARYLAADPGFESISVAVMGAGAPQELEEEADFTLSSVAEVEKFLAWLAARAARSGT